jgi:hypothetical protein
MRTFKVSPFLQLARLAVVEESKHYSGTREIPLFDKVDMVDTAECGG